ncbi:MAG: Threonylcarbamoyladenosine tRNA methylthiotransferase MtaB [Chlamydiae bacterium]|nr:Threonylcarbamoyladenosine tRNA methylthiotransferase MtaB [Chlamydiota bacterium]
MNSKKKLFRLATLGCRTNQYESQAYRDQLLGLGYKEAEEGEAADLCIVNTCTVTESADRSSRHQIRVLKRENPGAELVVTGCLAQRQPDELLQLGGVSKVVPNLKKERLVAELFPGDEIPEFSVKNFEGQTRAFVKVQDGCNSFCTYCIIPYVRGRSRSREIGTVVAEVEQLVVAGFKEVVITGINVGDFEGGLAKLVRAVDGIDGLQRLRISSIDPDEVDEELGDVVLNGRTTCRSMHIVLQSGSDGVLKRMNRKYTRKIFLDTIERLRHADPDFTFTTDVIVGFPGESEADFEATLEVIRETGFVKVHMFPFSPRERTRAALYFDQLAPELINERKQRVLQLSEEVAFKRRERYLGSKMMVLTEKQNRGHSDNFLEVSIVGGELKPNELLDVTITENTPEGLVGEV